MAIVNINVSVTSPPKPSQLLKSGALVSTGGIPLKFIWVHDICKKTRMVLIFLIKNYLREPSAR
ncbi:hypothetical protein CSL53_000884 [Salmonella enterica subsp. houtenae]|uniref:Uncharacterized protein n=1 Tax=Salmonella enterica TaxID=28901 RepID=A0A5V0IIH6_SALER|nr:hypothetical protein [Salmonella enterica subsp. houtenae]EDN5096003.1 hypothetical protein [Salmonella enterica subsp. houtenae]